MSSSKQRRLFRVYPRKEAEETYRKACDGIKSVLFCDEDVAKYLLHAYGANVNKINDAYFGDEEKTKRRLGLLTEDEEREAEKTDVLKLALDVGKQRESRRGSRTRAKAKEQEEGDRIPCGICFEDCAVQELATAFCRAHPFCKECWGGYCDAKFQDGKAEILDVRCPDPGCEKRVSTEMILRSLGDAEKVEKYRKYELEHFVESNQSIKHCPAAGCDHFLILENKDGLSPDQIQSCECACGKEFCWNCQEDEHIPVRCETAKSWVAKNSSESENQNWILTFTKPCPKCSRPIEKNQGCMHMTCSQCRHDFCWMCLDPWGKHGERTGGYYSCNAFRVEDPSNPKKTSEKEREVNEKKRVARMSIERYSHYHERWIQHQESEKRARADLKILKEKKADQVGRNHGAGPGEMSFAILAQEQIIECRKLLKWTYAHAYYAYNEEDLKNDWKKTNPFTGTSKVMQQEKEFYEFVQGEAENRLEQLSGKMEKDLDDFYNFDYIDYAKGIEFKQQKEANGDQETAPELKTPLSKDNKPINFKGDRSSFQEFKRKVCELTSLTRTSFQSLSDEIHKGFGCVGEGTPPPSAMKDAGKTHRRSSNAMDLS